MFRSRLSQRRNGGWRRAAVLGITVLLVSSCGTNSENSHVRDEITSLETFLRDGATRREDVIVRLGIPHATFENDRIVGYYLSARDELILVFDSQGQLARHRFLTFPKKQP